MANEPANDGRAPGADFDIALKAHARDPEQVRAALQGWFAGRLGEPGLRLGPIALPEGTGVANETLMVDAHVDERLARYVVRIATARPLYLDADIETHYKMYEALAAEPSVPSPGVVGYEPDPGIIGSPFFAMTRVEGDIPGDRPHYTTAGFVFDASPAERREMWENGVRAMAALHAVPAERFSFLSRGTGRSGLEEDLAYWRRYLDWATPEGPHPQLEQTWTWLQANLPADAPTAISWGDARFANIVFADRRVQAILDWDTVSLTGNEADLAWWIVMDHHATALLPGIGTPDELVELWQATTGRTAQHLRYHTVCTAFRLGAILCKLFAHMRDDGLMPPEVAAAQASNSPFVQLLCQLLDLTPPGEITAPVPDASFLRTSGR
jgi:aminoglycoside phosphotransferase (APT) family kinase protein